ncbi:hypothetical protein [Rummeliibacillus sp. POC4]|uniref:hypothetical protein n=1 Tax=Rummeliibacillus sp. POC4 TaxID=2305899 RepID=UPI000E66738F|nr:hypothetical protein [Rummeliibacillus sp. POC4]RIJ69372.1 hypothetical protein D1606_01000 [Rummeliibacillus sp. POC4]
MNAIEKMQVVLREDYGIYVPKEEITAEGVLLYADEIDETIVPIEMLVGVTETLQTEMTSYRDEHDNEYLLIQLEVGRPEPLEILLVNDEVVQQISHD